MADQQSNIAQEQLPIYDKATTAQYGSSDDTQSGTREGTATSAKIESPQPPASNPGYDNPSGGIGEGAGGLSSTAHIESPVPNNDQSLFSTVKSMLGFGTTEEIKAEDKEPAVNATTASPSSLLAGSAVAAPIAAATSSSTTGTTAATTSSSSDLAAGPTGKSGGTYLDYQQATSTDNSAFPSSQTLPIRSTPGGSLPSESTSSAAKTDTTSKVPETTNTDSKNYNTSADNTSSDQKMSEPDSKIADSDNPQERDGPKQDEPPVPADGKPSGGKGLEHRDAIPTAGGERLGEKHWGESNIVPDDPKRAAEGASGDAGVSSKDGQPNTQTKDNTSKNTGGATSGPHDNKAESGQSQSQSGAKGEEKEKFVDKIKDKLHMGKK